MGHVYRAVNEHVGRVVAIKVLRSEHAQNGQVVERFLREARAANLVRHPNVVDVLDIGREDGGSPFIVQELLVGEDLAHLVERRGGKLPADEVCDLLLPVIEAVAEAHARGVVHRDIKPENVFLASSPRGPIPKLLDFGISKVRAPDLRATEVGMMMGTPAYMAPEQVQGARDADPRSDVWALGVMMFELIAGRMPFDVQDAPALFVAIATKDAPSLLDVRAPVTADVSRVVERCLRRRPDERYPSAAELGRDLRHVLGGTDLEPTGTRALPTQLAELAPAFVPDLDFRTGPRTPAGVPAPVDGNGKTELGSPPSPGGHDAVAAASSRPPASTRSTPASAGGQRTALLSPPSNASQPMIQAAPELPAHSSRPSAPAASARPSGSMQAPSRLAPGASLSGVGLAPGPAAAMRGQPSHASWGASPKPRETADFSPIIGLGVVGLVSILGIGLLMQLAHRPEGWPIVQFMLGPTSGMAVPIHSAIALLAVALGVTFARRGVLHWRGDLSGGHPSAIVNAVVAAGAFFAAIELASAVY